MKRHEDIDFDQMKNYLIIAEDGEDVAIVVKSEHLQQLALALGAGMFRDETLKHLILGVAEAFLESHRQASISDILNQKN
jgi:hypothetical protein